MKEEIWVVTYHYGRGHVHTIQYDDKAKAQRAIEITVFNNEDCINCSIYRHDLSVIKNMVKETIAKM